MAGLVLGAVFVLVVFMRLPSWAIDLNRELSWPVWQTGPGQVLAVPLFVAGVGVVLYCTGLFAKLGRGSPVPVDPPTELVLAGLYRYSRNPIYVAYGMILCSYFLYSGEIALLAHAAMTLAFFEAWILFVEEPGLRRRFGPAYESYTREVPRWLGPLVAARRHAQHGHDTRVGR